MPSLVSQDRWLLWPAATALAAVTVLTFLCGLPGIISFILTPLAVLGFLVVAATLIVSVCVLVARRCLRKAASVALALFLPILFRAPIIWAALCLHLGLMIEYGVGQLGHVPVADGQQFAVYDWSTGFAGSPGTFVIHDVTDEIALPLAQHTRPATVENGWGEECAARVRHLLGHYYLCIVD